MTEVFAPINFATLVETGPERGPAVIDGVLREGAVGTLISSSKARKSWAVAALMAAVMTGGTWFGRQVTPGRVLLVDGELTLATIRWRLTRVFEAIGVGGDLFGMLDAFNLRGRTRDFPKAMTYAGGKGPGYYKMIIIDPLSVFYPQDEGARFDENSNGDMRRLMDGAIQFATETQAALMIVHHMSKGAQHEKAVVDLGAGAGSLVRSVDAHLAFRQHEEDDCIVLDGIVRDFPELVPSVWRWNFPTYSEAIGLDPDELRGVKKKKKNEVEEVTWTPELFVEQVFNGVEMVKAQALATAKGYGISNRQAMDLLKAGVAEGRLRQLGGTGKTPASYVKVKI